LPAPLTFSASRPFSGRLTGPVSAIRRGGGGIRGRRLGRAASRPPHL